jgi:Tol biopolymer transport system component
LKLLVSNKIGRCDWSPDGRNIVFQGIDDLNSSQIYVMDSDGNDIRKLTDSRVANPEAGVWQMVIDGDTVNMDPDYLGNYKPQFSSNGDFIFYLSSTDANNRALMRMDIEGNNKKEYSNVPDYHAISPASRYVLYTIDLDGIANEQIMLADLESGLIKNLSGERVKDTEPKFDKY